MDFSVPSPSSSSTSDSSGGGPQTDEYETFDAYHEYSNKPVSPRFMSSDLGLDPSDPLNLLLHNSSQGGNAPNNHDSSMEDLSSSSRGGTPPEWSDLSSLWSAHEAGMGDIKYPEIDIDFTVPMDYNPSMSIDPSALHYNPSGFSAANSYHGYSNEQLTLSTPDLLSAQFPFTFQPTNAELHQRRLSVGSSSSSSGASMSSVADLSPATPPTKSEDNDAAATELAHRVRQSAGVMLAVPMSMMGYPTAPQNHYPSNDAQPHSKPKLPIPRLPRTSSTFTNNSSTAPTTTANNSNNSNNNNQTFKSGSSSPDTAYSHSPMFNVSPIPATAPSSLPGQSTIPRPKTSHTTIERRYRTNLNARIQSLRMAVPALRVLEGRVGGKCGVPKKSAETNEAEMGMGGGGPNEEKHNEGDSEDVVDERGFVDGVKVARKCSKANVLGKAVEYIRVLKKRELRLKREQSGLKALVCGLVGGPALLKEWEREWKDRFGGEEMDEVEGEEGGSDDDEDEDGEDGEYDGEGGEGGRKRKKAKVVPKEKKPKAPPVQTTIVGGETVVLKRKRGRPRKIIPVVPPPMSPLTSNPNTDVEPASPPMPQQQQQHQPAQYLLATFAFFSFFNSPLTSPSQPTPSSSHTGTVLYHSQSFATIQDVWTWRQVIQSFHLLVSFIVFASIVIPWLPEKSRLGSFMLRPMTPAPPITTTVTTVTPPPVANKPKHRSFNRAAVIEMLAPSNRGTEDEAERLRAALGVADGVLGLAKCAIDGGKGKGGRGIGFEQRGLEQRAWVRLGEIVAMDPTTSLATRLQTFWCIRSHMSWFTASTSDLSTLALVIRPLSAGKASMLWDRARKAAGVVRPYERLVLDRFGVDEAAERLSAIEDETQAKYTPIGLLGSIVVTERVRKHAAILFVRTVLPDQQQDVRASFGDDMEREHLEEEEMRKTINAARSLGGRAGELGEMLESVWKTGVYTFEDEGENQDPVVAEIKALLSALVLYRRIFPTSILGPDENSGCGVSILLSPPPSPNQKDAKLHYALRRVLGSAVFDFSGEGDGEGDVERNKLGTLGIALEDARDRAVDMLVDCERQSRGGVVV